MLGQLRGMVQFLTITSKDGATTQVLKVSAMGEVSGTVYTLNISQRGTWAETFDHYVYLQERVILVSQGSQPNAVVFLRIDTSKDAQPVLYTRTTCTP